LNEVGLSFEGVILNVEAYAYTSIAIGDVIKELKHL
tara:strand:+ start:1913 stop:2020 length:108 start_codon:yes stop_codon:yes gene_type:complete